MEVQNPRMSEPSFIVQLWMEWSTFDTDKRYMCIRSNKEIPCSLKSFVPWWMGLKI